MSKERITVCVKHCASLVAKSNPMLFYSIKSYLRRSTPAPVLGVLLSVYHFSLAYLAALMYGFPSRRMLVIAVTGTKGKSSTIEMINAILEAAGYTTAVLNSIRIKVDTESEPNLMRMSMPGRFFIQAFLARAVRAGCTATILEMTSEGARQHRHRAIELDALVFTNLAPEHIESHGSYEAYANAKFEIGLQLARSRKRPRFAVINADDGQGTRYLTLQVEHPIPFLLAAHAPYAADDNGGHFMFEGENIAIKLPCVFSLYNSISSATLTRALGISTKLIAHGLASVTCIPGRAERIEAGQNFHVIVDYAHTIESQEAIYQAFGNHKKICVFGSCGGGRDTWVRPQKGQVAEKYCDTIILTNEDPYDEDPRSIVEAIAHGIKREPLIIMDRRAAIAHALSIAHEGDAVIITGKGTDPTIQGPRDTSTPWSDAQVTREEIAKMLNHRV